MTVAFCWASLGASGATRFGSGALMASLAAAGLVTFSAGLAVALGASNSFAGTAFFGRAGNDEVSSVLRGTSEAGFIELGTVCDLREPFPFASVNVLSTLLGALMVGSRTAAVDFGVSGTFPSSDINGNVASCPADASLAQKEPGLGAEKGNGASCAAGVSLAQKEPRLGADKGRGRPGGSVGVPPPEPVKFADD